MKMRKVCLVGGTGFVGRHIIAELARRGYAIRVLTRRRERRRELLVFPTLELVECDVHRLANLSALIENADAVISLPGILNEMGGKGEDFASVHAELPAKVTEACRYNRISRLLHMSALNASPSAPSEYLRSKAVGEEAAHAAISEGLHVTSFRPSVIFGPDDDFFNRFAKLLKMTPLVFPLACPNARFAPVYVEDVVHAFVTSLDDKSTYGKAFDLVGPREYTLKELVEYTAKVLGLRRYVWGLGDGLSRLQARALEFAPGKPFSRDNYLSMQVDSVSEDNGLLTLGIEPQGIEAIVPTYLGGKNRESEYQRLRGAARRT